MESLATAAAAITESRKQRRFNATKPISALLGVVPIDILNLGGGGLQIEHSVPMRIGSTGEITIESDGERPFVIPVRVAWSRLSCGRAASGKFLYHSGVSIAVNAPEVIGALGRLIRAVANPDHGSLERKRQALEKKRLPSNVRPLASTSVAPITAVSIPVLPYLEKIRSARLYLASNSDEAARWYSRARYSLAALQGFRSPTPPSQHALAIWEYLGGKVDLGEIIAAIDILDDEARNR